MLVTNQSLSGLLEEITKSNQLIKDSKYNQLSIAILTYQLLSFTDEEISIRKFEFSEASYAVQRLKGQK